MRRIAAIKRMLRVLMHILQGAWTIRWVFPTLTQVQRDLRVSQWAQAMLAHMRIHLTVEGTPPVKGPVLLVSNHISWLDIIVIHAAGHCRFVSKADVQRWPLVGTLATGAGTLFIERESRRDAMRVVHHMAESLSDGDILAVFPEGTTGEGRELLPFHANLLQAAIATNAPVQPLALRFMDGATGAQSFAPRFVGDDTLVASLWRTLCAQQLHACVRYGDVEWFAGRDRRNWAADLRVRIQGLLDENVNMVVPPVGIEPTSST